MRLLSFFIVHKFYSKVLERIISRNVHFQYWQWCWINFCVEVKFHSRESRDSTVHQNSLLQLLVARLWQVVGGAGAGERWEDSLSDERESEQTTSWGRTVSAEHSFFITHVPWLVSVQMPPNNLTCLILKLKTGWILLTGVWCE